MEEYKENYNKLLERYYNGCNYIKENIDKYDKYDKILLNILNDINIIILQHPEMTSNEILKGFK